MSGRGRGGSRGGRGGAGRGGSRGGRGGSAASSRPATEFPARTVDFGIDAETREQEERLRRANEEKRLKLAEEERTKAIQEQQRRVQSAAEQERAKLSEQRRLYEEQIKIQREAVLKAEAERMRRLEEAQQEIARRREVALREIAIERENRERVQALEAMEKDRSSKKVQQQQQVAKKPVEQVIRQKPEKRKNFPSNNSDNANHANFVPSTYDDHQILAIYHSRHSPDPSLPPVPFTKKGNLYYLGLRKCEIIEQDGEFHVKLNVNTTEDLQTWLEKIERVEGLRTKGMNAARLYQNVGQMQIC
jgi:hypothetical protein